MRSVGLLRAGHWWIEADTSLLEVAGPRCQLAAFRAPPEAGEPRLTMRWVQSLAAGAARLPLDSPYGLWGYFTIAQTALEVVIVENPFAAEAALRTLVQVAVMRQGGFLIHGSAVAFGDEAIVATGPSGAGKSTLARLCTQEGQGLLLTDEVVALYPGGEVHGTPFRSDEDMAGSPPVKRLAGLFLLEKGAAEAVAPVPARQSVPALVSQTFRPVPGELRTPELLARVGQVADRGVFQLTFRKHRDVAGYMAGWVSKRAGAKA